MAKLNGGTRIYGNATIDTFATISGNLNTVGGNVNIASGTGVTSITRTVQGSGYTTIPTITVSAPTSIGGITATATANMQNLTATPVAGGTGYTVGDTVSLVGGTIASGSTVGTFRVATLGASNAIASMDTPNFGTYSVLPTNPVSLTGGTGSLATANITYLFGTANITNAGSGYVSQPTITFSGGGGSGAAAIAVVGTTSKLQILGSSLQFYTPGGIQAQISDTYTGGISTNFIQIRGRGAGAGPIIQSSGESNVSLNIATSGTGSMGFQTQNGGTNQFSIAHVASAVNNLTVSGAIDGAAVPLSATGSSANISVAITTKGTGILGLNTGLGGSIQFQPNGARALQVYNGGGSNQNWFQLSGAAVGSPPYIVARSGGTDTNVGLVLSTVGTGNLDVYTNDYNGGTGNLQARVAHTANAVSYIQLQGGNAGNAVVISAQSSAANVDIAVTPRGTGNVTTTGNISTSGFVKTTAVVVASLPTAAGAGAGARSFVTDATAATFGTVAAGGGANAVPVWSDGTNWKIG